MGIHTRDSRGRIQKGNNLKHGLSDDPIYDCYIAMVARCYKSHHPMFKHYGGRGIKVCERWLLGFDNFLADMGRKPSKQHTLERINNDGDYAPENCRWATIQEQQANKRTNGIVVGVNYEKSRKKWRATITRNRERHFLGRYSDFEIAIKVRKAAEQIHDVSKNNST